MKKYKVGSLVYTARDAYSDFANSPAYGPGVRIICWSAMNALIKDGIATEVRETYKTTNQAPNIFQHHVTPCGRHWMYVDAEFVELYRKGADVLVTFEEIITQESDKS